MNIFKLLFIFALVMSVSHAWAQNPTVTSLYPDRNASNVPKDVDIVVTFDQELLASTINSTTVFVRGDITGRHYGVIDYDPSTSTMTFYNNYDFLAGEIVTVQLTREIKAPGGVPLDQSQYWTFTIATTAGTGIFTWDTTYYAGSDVMGMTAADMDGDYDADIVSKDWGGAIYVQENDGSGTFTPWDVFYSGFISFDIATGDLNGDALVDLIAVYPGIPDYGFSGLLGAMINNGDGTFNVVENTCSMRDKPYYVKLMDMNVDGALDALIYFAGRDSDTTGFGWQVNSNTSDGSFGFLNLYFDWYGMENSASIGPIGDFNNDGFADFILYCAGLRLVYTHYDGSVTFDTTTILETGWGSVGVADFNGDGWLDLCSRTAASPSFMYHEFRIRLNNQDGTFSLDGTYLMPGICDYHDQLCSVAPYLLGDVNADGATDIVAIRTTYDIWNDSGFVFLNNGDGTFGELLPMWPIGEQPIPKSLADLDNDGDLDLIAYDHYGSGNYLTRVITNLTSIPPAVCGDANGDDEPNVGDAVFVINYVFKGGPPPDPVCAGDANDDGECNVGDAVYLINFVFKGGPPPVESCCY